MNIDKWDIREHHSIIPFKLHWRLAMMSPQIRVDEEVYEALKHKAEPFLDTPNSVLRRVLGLDSVASETAHAPADPKGGNGTARTAATRPRSPGRAKAGELLPIEAYYEPIMRSLVRHDGSARVALVLDEVGQELFDQLTPIDHLSLPTGGKRWRNRVQWARQHLVDQGLLEAGSPHGTWSITPEGRAYLESKQR
jgi:hypothetical protein